jgi:hypothetical protein
MRSQSRSKILLPVFPKSLSFSNLYFRRSFRAQALPMLGFCRFRSDFDF